MKFNKKFIFQNFISQTLELRTVKQRHPYFLTRLERLLPICDRRWIAGVCCPNQIKNHHFVICRALTSYLSLNFIVTCHAELQSPRGRRFCLLCWSTFYGTIQGYTKRGRIKCPGDVGLEILASTASIFTQILAHKPPNLEIFSSQAPLFRGKYQFASPTLRESGLHTPTWKKVECPPRI